MFVCDTANVSTTLCSLLIGFMRSRCACQKVVFAASPNQHVNPNMVMCLVTIHPKGLSLKEAAKAWYLRLHERKKWREIRTAVRNVQGKTPSLKAVSNAVSLMSRVDASGVPKTKYDKCGRKPALSPAQERRIVNFVLIFITYTFILPQPIWFKKITQITLNEISSPRINN